MSFIDDPEATIIELKEKIDQHWEDTDYLSKAVIDIARWSYWHNIKVAEAEKAERQAFLDAKGSVDRISNDEAQATAVTKTVNAYGLLKLDQASNEHFMNAIKLRIRVLMGEKDATRLE